MLRYVRRRTDKGASLIEFAIIMPLLVMLLFGIVEFGWGLAQQIDLRHKAREALRMAIVDDPIPEITDRICNEDIVRNSDLQEVTRQGSTVPGEKAEVVVVADVQQLTGFFGWLWGSNPTISSTVDGRVEQETSNWLPGENLAASC
ncbi:MAG TPA: TadE family protein [Acidimicrobiia bacterium]|nr:TadE family protein [Acidimicrobiia bacterium]